MDAFTTPFPPVVPAFKLAAQLRVWGVVHLARLGVLPLRRFAHARAPLPGEL